MDICTYRKTQHQHRIDYHYCTLNKGRCAPARQILCTAPDIWPVWLVVVFLFVFVLAGATI